MMYLHDVSIWYAITLHALAATWLGTELDDYCEMFLHFTVLQEVMPLFALSLTSLLNVTA